MRPWSDLALSTPMELGSLHIGEHEEPHNGPVTGLQCRAAWFMKRDCHGTTSVPQWLMYLVGQPYPTE